jgi:hypothetical protein
MRQCVILPQQCAMALFGEVLSNSVTGFAYVWVLRVQLDRLV